MQDKKVVALIVLTVLAVISLIYGVMAPPKGRVRSAAPVERQFAATPPQNVKSVISTDRRAKRSQFNAWKRNPFTAGQAGSVATALTLNGIIWSKTTPKAMIGDVMVVKGDTIGDNKVVDIRPDKVILNDGTKDFELTMER